MKNEDFSVEFTGERYVPTLKGQIRYEHLHRYAACSELVKDKDVLDIACGEGYGSALLARFARKVIGVDIDEFIINYAKNKYSFQQNLQFIVGGVDSIPLPDASVDVVVSFETIEHHDKHEEMLQEIKRVLRPEGMLVISTPDKRTYSDLPKWKNKFHVKELYLHEFENLLKKYFKYVTLHGQRLATGSFINVLEANNICNFDTYEVWSVENEIVKRQVPILVDPVYIIAVCSDNLPLMLKASVFIDSEDDIYIEKDNQLRNLTQVVREQEMQLRSLSQAVAERDMQIAEIFSSRSWRVTEPFRKANNMVRSMLGRIRKIF